MQFAYDVKGNKVHITDSDRNNSYYCPICSQELILKKGFINKWHFAHKNKTKCDEWYEMSEWHIYWQEKFPKELREIIIHENGEKHRADIKAGNLVVEFQKSKLKAEDFYKRNKFYTRNNNLVWLFDLREKDIRDISKYNKTRLYEWKYAYKLNKFPISPRIKIFFQISNSEIVYFKEEVYNKGFKFFKGVPISEYDFIEILRNEYKKAKDRSNIIELSYDELLKFAISNGY